MNRPAMLEQAAREVRFALAALTCPKAVEGDWTGDVARAQEAMDRAQETLSLMSDPEAVSELEAQHSAWLNERANLR
jgi:hypothetical protein